MYY
ncbi:BgTH12-02533 [Blumeria graminis f. sp. triticale]|jgi:hypothetical protein